MALRVSLGASRARLIRQLVTESLALSAMGGAAGISVAYAVHGALVRMLAESDPRFSMSLSVDPLLLAFVLAATLAAALLFGVLPAWHVTKTDAGASLTAQSRGAIGSFVQMRSGRFLVSLQLALSLPLLVCAGLLARTVSAFPLNVCCSYTRRSVLACAARGETGSHGGTASRMIA